jgi:uncharacterized protein (TIGR02246 family)
MKPHARYVILAGAAVLGLAVFLDSEACSFRRRFVAQTVAVVQPEAKDAKGKLDPAKEAVMANVRAFAEGFNRQDVKAILKLYTEDCVLTEADGDTIRGLKELEAELTETFQNEPKARISVAVESLQVVTPDVIIEEGKTTYYPDGKTLTAETSYEVTHVKRGGQWLMKRARSFNRVVLSPYDDLRELEWLVGDWIDEGDDGVVIEASYHWDVNKVFLLNKFSIRANGQKILTGTQRIGRDPLSKQIKAWVFDSEGGYAESLWSSVDDSWIAVVKGVRTDGKVVTMTNRYTPLGKDRFRFDSVDRIVGEERMPNLSNISVRKPPEAK